MELPVLASYFCFFTYRTHKQQKQSLLCTWYGLWQDRPGVELKDGYDDDPSIGVSTDRGIVRSGRLLIGVSIDRVIYRTGYLSNGVSVERDICRRGIASSGKRDHCYFKASRRSKIPVKNRTVGFLAEKRDAAGNRRLPRFSDFSRGGVMASC